MSNDIEATLRLEIGRVEGQLEKVYQGQQKLARGFEKAGDKAQGMGSRIGVAAGATQVGLTAVLNLAVKIAKTFQEIDDGLAKISRTSGAQNLDLSRTLTGLGVKDTGKIARVIRGAQGVSTQGEIDSFLGSISDNLNDKQASGVGRQFARGGSAVFGSGASLAGLSGVLGDTNSGDLGDLAVQFRTAAGGDFGNSQGKQFNQLAGLGVDRNTSLALISTFQRRGQSEGLNAIIAEIAGGRTSVEEVLAGQVKSRGGQAAIAGLGDQLGRIGSIAGEFASADTRDVVGEQLASLESNPAARRELDRRRRARSAEIAVNQAADEGLGAAEQARKDALDEFESNLQINGGVGSSLGLVATRLSRATFGDRATGAAAGTGDDVADRIGAAVGKAVQTKAAGN